MLPAGVRVWVCTVPVDMRRGFDTLAQSAREKLGQDPMQGGVFVFVGRRGTRLKMLWFDRHRCCLLSVRLHQAVFHLPPSKDVALRIDAAQLAKLLEGMPRPARRS